MLKCLHPLFSLENCIKSRKKNPSLRMMVTGVPACEILMTEECSSTLALPRAPLPHQASRVMAQVVCDK